MAVYSSHAKVFIAIYASLFTIPNILGTTVRGVAKGASGPLKLFHYVKIYPFPCPRLAMIKKTEPSLQFSAGFSMAHSRIFIYYSTLKTNPFVCVTESCLPVEKHNSLRKT